MVYNVKAKPPNVPLLVVIVVLVLLSRHFNSIFLLLVACATFVFVYIWEKRVK